MNLLKVGTIAIDCDVVSHPLLGDAYLIVQGGEPITAMSAIDWDAPQEIPVVAEPGRLPPGAGGMLLNEIARRARRPLRYAGPYPTPALYRALLRSFRASAPEEVFTRDVLARALRLARDEVPVDFAPAPHERVELACGHVEVREGIERAVIAGTAYERDGSVCRLDGMNCEVWFGDACYARIATLDARAALVDGPHAPPDLRDPIVGQVFPQELRAAIAELVAEAVPAPLAADARRMLTEREVAWADLGTRAARRTTEGFAVHAALWLRIAPKGLARVALAIAEALAPVVTAAILADVQGRAPLA